jgi:uncharacterized repeat protein (TIGR04052 family)
MTLLWLVACKSATKDPGQGATTDIPITEEPEDTGPFREPITLEFGVSLYGEVPSCDTPVSVNSLVTGGGATLADLRFYISDIDVLAVDGSPLPVVLIPDGVWQTETVALLDFENGTGTCVGGTPEVHTTIQGKVSPGEYNGVRFDLFVPFAENHAALGPPLDAPGMFVNAQHGHEFFKLDLDIDGNPWSAHVHSLECTSTGTDAAPTSCDRPNGATIELINMNPAAETITLSLATLFGTLDPTDEDPASPPGCQSDLVLDDDECPTVYNAFGLSWQTGYCVDGCAGQTLVTAL